MRGLGNYHLNSIEVHYFVKIKNEKLGMKFLIAALNIVLLTACASTDMSEALNGGRGNLPIQQFAEANSIEEIRKLKPQATLPIKIAVIPVNYSSMNSIEERQTLFNWSEKLHQTGFISSLDIVPEVLRPKCGYRADKYCYLKESRIAGARLGADALLFINDKTVKDTYANPLSFLNLTVIGMWIIPAHHRDYYSIYEASLFDINNGYLYTLTEGYGEHKTLRPLFNTDHESGQKAAKLAALNQLGEKLLALAQETTSATN